MTPYVITFVVMVGVFMIGCFALKLPVGSSALRSFGGRPRH